MKYYSAIKRNEILPFSASRMNLEIIILRLAEKDKYYMISLIYGIYKTNTTELIYKRETDPQTRKTNYGYQRGKGTGKGKDEEL